jgi:uncharacterized membrane protein YesL
VDGSIRRALRTSLTDFYFNSWRLVPANLVWAGAFIALLLAAVQLPPAILLTGVLAIPLAGLHRMAALIARGEPATFSDFLGGMRRYGIPALAIGSAATLLVLVLVMNTLMGFETGGPMGWFLGVSALYGLAGLAIYLVALWPVLVDPRREAASLRRRLALAGVVVIARPMRAIGLAVVVVALLGLSVVLFAAIVLMSVAYTSLVAARVVLPTVDEIEARVPEGRLPG